MRDAILKHEGVLGTLLGPVEAVEAVDFDRVEVLRGGFGLDLAQLQRAENQAYVRVHGLGVDC